MEPSEENIESDVLNANSHHFVHPQTSLWFWVWFTALKKGESDDESSNGDH